MPMIRKIIQVGTSKAISLPKSWLEFYERKTGQHITEVSIEINGKLIVQPILSRDQHATE
jgi:hypothetical protein